MLTKLPVEAFSHMRDGKVVVGQLVRFQCATELIIYTPTEEFLDQGITKAIIVVRNPHSHPLAPDVKPTKASIRKIEKVIEAMPGGSLGLTANRLRKCKALYLLLE